jgi:hypothetical protein
MTGYHYYKERKYVIHFKENTSRPVGRTPGIAALSKD